MDTNHCPLCHHAMEIIKTTKRWQLWCAICEFLS